MMPLVYVALYLHCNWCYKKTNKRVDIFSRPLSTDTGNPSEGTVVCCWFSQSPVSSALFCCSSKFHLLFISFGVYSLYLLIFFYVFCLFLNEILFHLDLFFFNLFFLFRLPNLSYILRSLSIKLPSLFNTFSCPFPSRSVVSSTVSPQPFGVPLGRLTSGIQRYPVRWTATSSPSQSRWRSERMMARATTGIWSAHTHADT